MQKILIVLLLFLFLLPSFSLYADETIPSESPSLSESVSPDPSVLPSVSGEPSISLTPSESKDASDGKDYSGLIGLTVVGDGGKIYKLKQLTGSGELISMAEVNTISFVFSFAKELTD